MDEFDIYLNLFYEEMDKYLRVLNENVLLLEEQPDNTEVIHAIFRSAHSMKGMAATMGLKTIADLTHEMETVFQLLKDEEIQVTHDLMTTIFTCLDTLAEIVEDLQSGGDGNLDIKKLVEDLKLIASDGSEAIEETTNNTSAPKKELTSQLLTWDASDLLVIEEGKKQGYQAYVVTIRLDEETAMKGARAFLLMNALEAAGELILTEPSIEALETGEFEGDIHVLYLTKSSSKEVEALVLAESDIEAVTVTEASEILVEETEESTKEDAKEKSIPTPQSNRSQKRETLRVDLNRINQFMNLVSELVIHPSKSLRRVNNGHRDTGSNGILRTS